MLWLIGIVGVWLLLCVLAVSLCVMARRGDEALAWTDADEAEVGFVAGFAEPALQPEPVRPRRASHSTR